MTAVLDFNTPAPKRDLYDTGFKSKKETKELRTLNSRNSNQLLSHSCTIRIILNNYLVILVTKSKKKQIKQE